MDTLVAKRVVGRILYVMYKILRNNYLFLISTILFIVTSLWWFTIYFRGLTEGQENDIYTLAYPFLALLGGLIGCIAAQNWGGFNSKFGKAIYLLTFGLLAQFVGQCIYAYYIYIAKIEVPYPSFGDIGFFGSVLFYIAGLFYLAQTIAVRITLQTIAGKLKAFLLPLILLTGSYFLFLQGYVFEPGGFIKSFLDFGYPLGQSFYLSLAIIILLSSRNLMGGLMKKPLMLLIFALVAQYFADFMFLYQANWGTWYVAGPNDFLYAVSYYLMTLALVLIGTKYREIRDGNIS